MSEPLKILMLEDSVIDAEIIQRVLLKDDPDIIFRLVMNKEDFLDGLEQFHPDLILSDNTLPQFDATEALEIFNERSFHIPFILVTGTVSEEFAAGIIKLGADDYILKDRLTRLPGAIKAGLKKKKTEAAMRHSEDVRRLIMNSALDAIICMDTNGLITVWNPQAEKLFGWKEEEMIGQKLAEIIIPHQYREAHAKGLDNYLKTGEAVVLNKVIEITALDKQGNEFPIELAIVPIKQVGEDFFCAFVRDISERKKAEESMKLMERQMLDQKIEEQKRISRAIIKAQEQQRNHIGQELHDNINQILAGTKMYLSMAAKNDDALKELLKYPMELIDSSIEEIRLLSRKQVTPLKDINLQEMIKDILNTLSKNSGIKTNLVYIASTDLPDDLKLNIYRIIQEQVNNILKHAAAKNVSISIRTEDKTVNIIVTDDGKGFNVSSKRKGIGISNMINRIETYNGTVSIESSPGNGSKIIVAMPY